MPGVELKGAVTLDGSGFDRTMGRLKQTAMGFVNDLTPKFGGLGNLIGGVFTAATAVRMGQSIVQHADRIKDLADQYSLTGKEVQLLDFALSKSGLRFEDATTALRSLNEALSSAESGDPDAVRRLRNFGITVKDVKEGGKSLFDVLAMVGDGLRSMGSDTRTSAAMMELLGSKSLRLQDALRELRATRDEVGPFLVGEDELNRIDRLMNKLAAIKLAWLGFGASVMDKFLENPMRLLGLGPAKTAIDELRKRLKEAAEQTVSGEALPIPPKAKDIKTKKDVEDLSMARGINEGRIPQDMRRIVMEVNALQRVGAEVRRASGDPMVQLSREQLKELREIVRNTRQERNGLF